MLIPSIKPLLLFAIMGTAIVDDDDDDELVVPELELDPELKAIPALGFKELEPLVPEPELELELELELEPELSIIGITRLVGWVIGINILGGWIGRVDTTFDGRVGSEVD